MLSWRKSKECIQKASNAQKRASHDNSSSILTYDALKQVMVNEEASRPQQNSALDHKWFSFHMGEEWDSNIDIGLHQANNQTSHCYQRNVLESM